ncbi:hypothetical protein [Methylotenera mobilis]|uniref:hypothetical protein n=1 Tax=Methylotenera mobilis TaxID=359408 RepID=UPI00037F5F4E|nr:hypothetical protein [Methylotenera mobilis]
MRQPYENVYIGNFIYTLGYLAGQRGINIANTSMQLLQQTPADCSIGDLLTKWGGKNFIFEFKRSEKLVQQEFKKDHKNLLINTIKRGNQSKFLDISKKCHFMAFPFEIAEKTTLNFMCYIDIRNQAIQYHGQCLDMTAFCNDLLNSNAAIGVDSNEFSEYLDYIATFTDGDSSEGFTGVIVNVTNKGEINMFEIDNLRILSHTIDSPELELVREHKPPRGMGGHSIG